MISYGKWILGLLLGFIYSPLLADASFLQNLTSQPTLRTFLAFCIIFAITVGTGKILAEVLSTMLSGTISKNIDWTLGLLFGLILTAVLITLLLIAGQNFGLSQLNWWQNATLINLFLSLEGGIIEIWQALVTRFQSNS